MDFSETTGQQIRDENVRACMEIFKVIETSFGPISFDKMIINELGEICFTNDGANILKRIEILHPAAKILVSLSQQQDEEIGDGTTGVVLIACELLKRANELINKKIHPSVVISAYRLAMCYACRRIKENMCVFTGLSDTSFFINVAKTSLSSKIIGLNSKKFATISFYVIKSVFILEKKKKKIYFELKAINFVKVYGDSMNSSHIFDGCVIEHQEMFSNVVNYTGPVKIMCFNFDLKLSKPKLGVSVQTKNLSDIKTIFDRELKALLVQVKNIVQVGVNLIFTTKNIDDFIVKYLVKNGIVIIRRISDIFIKKIAAITGLKVQNSLKKNNLYYDTKFLQIGEAEEFFKEKISSENFILLRGCRFCPSGSVILRGATGFLLDEIAHALYDAMCAIKKAAETNKFVTGGGSVETNLSVSLEKLASNIYTQEQLGILEFSEALLVIPKTLCKNAGLNYTEILSKLKILHLISLYEKFSQLKHFGIDLFTGQLVNQLKNGIVEPAVSKIKSIQIATEATITLLRIDDFIISTKQNKNK
ncbi:t-complex protein 1 alpha SU (nucleomorph) [Cryptomonas paramecium]|uniref:T-complex protein 1 alpha SU n=1 Tax=Cryptomonas paramaecium TaxID=2898 RepID=F2HHF2_9CRYP|nr:t-complex protein 1 alpha SU [Cryptomonas paramecium]AEA38748.1 t-complex protein 1 alpha SU [Cryptomonas paramecium]|mmetsp:Transcript_74476/g.199070  ORF Transcript_74476/g.199070 Transcript_74476/m.199070 type:complete len:535 (+) Transcript_74476:1791-3395(+)